MNQWKKRAAALAMVAAFLLPNVASVVTGFSTVSTPSFPWEDGLFRENEEKLTNNSLVLPQETIYWNTNLDATPQQRRLPCVVQRAC